MDSMEATALDVPNGQRVLNGTAKLVGNALCFVPTAGMLAGIGVAYFGATQLEGEFGLPGPNPPLGRALIALGMVAAIGSFLWNLFATNKLGGWVLQRRARAAVKARPDEIVDPDDPDALFVDIVPRAHWGKMMIENATDVGFLAVDDARRELRFEGDCERLRIPAAAILACWVQEDTIAAGTTGAISYAMLAVRVRAGKGVRELPFVPRGTIAKFGAAKRTARMEALRARGHPGGNREEIPYAEAAL